MSANVFSIAPRQAFARLQVGARLIDVRESHEHAGGHAEGADLVSMAELLAAPHRYIAGDGRQVVLICQSGKRSLTAAQALSEAGFAEIASVEGGIALWMSEGLPVVIPEQDAEVREFNERYARHLMLPQVGHVGQHRLRAACVLLVGAGGLGSPVAFYLAAAGVGTLKIVDDDAVDRSNLQRQIVHTESRIGMPKVDSAAIALQALNPGVNVQAINERVTAEIVERLLQHVDVVVDGADNFATRYLLNDACVKYGKPLVHGAVQGFEGQVSVFDAGRHRGHWPCYRCLFPVAPPPEMAPNCAEAGVLGVLPGIVGIIQASETIKLLLEIGESLAGRLLHVDALTMRFREMRFSIDPDCPVCGLDATLPSL